MTTFEIVADLLQCSGNEHLRSDEVTQLERVAVGDDDGVAG